MSGVAGITFLLALLAVGVIAARRGQGPVDYFLAGRRLGPVVLVLTTMASIMSGFAFVGGPGLFYEIGLGSFWITISSSFTGALMGWLLARPLFEMSHGRGCLTIPEVIRARFVRGQMFTPLQVTFMVQVKMLPSGQCAPGD